MSQIDHLDDVLNAPDPAKVHPMAMSIALVEHLGVDLPYNAAVAALRTDAPLSSLDLCVRARHFVRSVDGFNFEPTYPQLFRTFVKHRRLLKWFMPFQEAAAKLILRDYDGAEPPRHAVDEI